MTRGLLDVNVLIALLDSEHLHHEAANDWFADHARTGWATCPITQNGAVRILANPNYAASPGPPAVIAEVVAKLCARNDHEFWPDLISLLDPARRPGAAAELAAPDRYLSARPGAGERRPPRHFRPAAADSGGRQWRAACPCDRRHVIAG